MEMIVTVYSEMIHYCALRFSQAGASVNLFVHIFVKSDLRILFLEECALSRL